MYAHRISAFNREDDVQVKITDGSVIEGEYVSSTDAFIFIANESGQFSLPTSNVIWIRKDLIQEGY